jgi:hypothetical protein
MVTAKDIYNKILSRIIQEQEMIVGSLAWEIAVSVKNLVVVDKQTYQISITGEPKNIINDIVARYQKVFGMLAIDVSKQAVFDVLADMSIEDIPASLQ